jgi:hypothetical protein
VPEPEATDMLYAKIKVRMETWGCGMAEVEMIAEKDGGK